MANVTSGFVQQPLTTDAHPSKLRLDETIFVLSHAFVAALLLVSLVFGCAAEQTDDLSCGISWQSFAAVTTSCMWRDGDSGMRLDHSANHRDNRSLIRLHRNGLNDRHEEFASTSMQLSFLPML